VGGSGLVCTLPAPLLVAPTERALLGAQWGVWKTLRGDYDEWCGDHWGLALQHGRALSLSGSHPDVEDEAWADSVPMAPGPRGVLRSGVERLCSSPPSSSSLSSSSSNKNQCLLNTMGFCRFDRLSAGVDENVFQFYQAEDIPNMFPRSLTRATFFHIYRFLDMRVCG